MEQNHNICAFVDADTPKAFEYREILQFLRRSRIFYAISAKPVVYQNLIAEFWSNAEFDSSVEPNVIRSRVDNRAVVFSVATVRTVLQFPESDDHRLEYPTRLIHRCFRRMNYRGAMESLLRKNRVSKQWRYLIHVLIQCISPQMCGYEKCRASIQSAIVALVLNKPYDFGYLVFKAMVENASAKMTDKVLMYPRFLQLILNHLLPNLPTVGPLVHLMHMKKTILSRTNLVYQLTAPELIPIDTPLFGHLINPNYQAPPNDGWINAEEDGGKAAAKNIQAQHGEPNVQQQEPQQQEEPENVQQNEEVVQEGENANVENLVAREGEGDVRTIGSTSRVDEEGKESDGSPRENEAMIVNTSLVKRKVQKTKNIDASTPSSITPRSWRGRLRGRITRKLTHVSPRVVGSRRRLRDDDEQFAPDVLATLTRKKKKESATKPQTTIAQVPHVDQPDTLVSNPSLISGLRKMVLSLHCQVDDQNLTIHSQGEEIIRLRDAMSNQQDQIHTLKQLVTSLVARLDKFDVQGESLVRSERSRLPRSRR